MAQTEKQIQAQQRNIQNAGNRRLRTTEANIVDYMELARKETQVEVDKLYNDVLDGEDEDLFVKAQKNGRLDTVLKNISLVVFPILTRRDNNIERNMVNDYNVTWYDEWWRLSNNLGINVNFGDVRKRLRKAALENPVSKLNTPDWVKDRRKFIAKINTTIRQGLVGDWDIRRMSKELDIVYGFRDRKGRLINLRKRAAGEIANSFRVARTEIVSMRSLAQKDAMRNAQRLGINERLQLISVLDDRTRDQSRAMDRDISREDGKFKYPDGQWYFKGSQPIQWRANDRETTVPIILDVNNDIDQKVKKAEETGNTVNYGTFGEFATVYGINVDRDGKKVNLD